MSGGVFTLILNEGIQDKMLMATDYLKCRVEEIVRANKLKNQARAQGNAGSQKISAANSWEPSINEIEKSHNIFINGSFKPFVAMAYEYTKTTVSEGSLELGSTIAFKIPQFGDFFNDMVVNVRLSGLRSVDQVNDRCRYISLLGHRIFSKVSFYIQNNLIDDYTPNEYNAYYNFHVPPNKRIGWLRNMGQEIPTLGYVTADPRVDESREYRWFGRGAQTFKPKHDTVDLWVPILFWFRELKHAVPNLVIPFGQTKLELKLAPDTDLISYSTPTSAPFSTANPPGAYITPKIERCELYTNHIFMLPFMHEIFIKNYGFSLIRVHRRQIRTVTANSGNIKLNELKWPIETMYVAFRPVANRNITQSWYSNNALTENQIPVPVCTGVVPVLSINQVVSQIESPSVDSLELQAHGVVLFKDTAAGFYNSYMPYRYGTSINTPEDPGWFMMNFNFNPGDNDPSGHINVSQAREFYLSYTSSYIDKNHETEMIVLADALNFLLVKSGSAILRFST
jgi:hypothetical protein